jgi:uncharacterized protein
MSRANPVLWITLALPLIVVAASFLTLAAAVRHPDNELPEQYHWEGLKLDRDFERSGRAAALGVRAELRAFDRAGRCQVRLEIAGIAPRELYVRMTHATQPTLDRAVRLHRNVTSSLYDGECHSMPDGHWRVELTDGDGEWSIRQSVRGSLNLAWLDAPERQGSQP